VSIVVTASDISYTGSSVELKPPKQDDLLLTGDDLVVEYVDRIGKALARRYEMQLPSFITQSLMHFIYFKVWDQAPIPVNLLR
jgi:hypothetical protein